MGSDIQAARERLAHDLKNVVHDSEVLIREIGGDLSEKGKQARARLAATLETAKSTCHDLQEKAVAGAKVADRYVQENPYKTMGAAFGLGILLGVLVARK